MAKPDGDGRETDEAKISELVNRMEALKREKVELSKENNEMKEKMNKLHEELMDKVQNKSDDDDDDDEWEDDTSSFLESMAARSGELEREVRRLQHDVITSNGELEEAKREVAELKKGLEEKALAVERLRNEIGELRKEKVKSEKKGRELETKIGILEVRVKDEKGNKGRVEEEMKAKMDDLNNKIQQYLRLFNDTNHQLKLSKQQKRESEDKVMGLELNLLALKDLVNDKTNQAAFVTRNLNHNNIDSQLHDKNNVFLLTLATGTLAAVVSVVAAVNRSCSNNQIDG